MKDLEKKLKYLVEEVLCWFRQNAIKCTFKVWKSLSLSHPLTHTHTHPCTHTHTHARTHTLTHTHTRTLPLIFPFCSSFLFNPFIFFSFYQLSLFPLSIFLCFSLKGALFPNKNICFNKIIQSKLLPRGRTEEMSI